jgi:hypothetical protein
MTDEQPAQREAPFIPSDASEPPIPDAPWRVFGSKAFFRLWVAQCVSSLGDWIGLIAILAIAARVSNNSGAAVSLVMTTRVLPGFLLGTVGGVIIDRFDRRKVMVLATSAARGLSRAALRRQPRRTAAHLARARCSRFCGVRHRRRRCGIVDEEHRPAIRLVAASFGTFDRRDHVPLPPGWPRSSATSASSRVQGRQERCAHRETRSRSYYVGGHRPPTDWRSRAARTNGNRRIAGPKFRDQGRLICRI